MTPPPNPCCHWRVRPNALHITFWSFYDLSISFIVTGHHAIPLYSGCWAGNNYQCLSGVGQEWLSARWHNTLNRISYWRALKSQIIHGGSSTIVLTVAFCSKDNREGIHRWWWKRRHRKVALPPIVCQLSHCSALSLCSAICGRVART